ncbi:MAG: phosphotransferase, partial [Oscillospiraceae bacterium]|nr:phosphotransferase [Oscillospiraceae bacterium]
IAQVMARIHMTDLSFPEDGAKTEMPARERIAECFDGWKSVLDEHSMDAGGARTVADRICDVIRLHDAEEDVTVHGDLHRENLLTDGERIIVCDWQAVGRGKATDDIGFFLSRAAADGIHTDPREFAAMYADAVYELCGRSLDVSDIMAGISAANVITTFFYWHLFLHGSSADIVGDVYNRMIYDLGRCVEL